MSAPKFPPTYHPPRVPKDWEVRAEMIRDAAEAKSKGKGR